jgi:pilus assembly protein CpaD
MRTKLCLLLVASSLSACAQTGEIPAARGLSAVNEPVLSRAAFSYDLAAPAGVLAPQDVARLDSWFRTMNLGYGDSIYVDGPYADSVRGQVAQVAGNYGMVVLPSAPVLAGAIGDGTVRVIVSRTRAEVPGCPKWEQAPSFNYTNRSTPNFGCAVNANLAAMVANPEDLFRGRDNGGLGDTQTASKAVEYYRTNPPTGKKGLQSINTKEGK